MKPRVVLTRRIFDELLPRFAECELVDNQADVLLDSAALATRLKGAHVLMCGPTDRVDAALIDGADRLRAICNVAVGHNNIDLGACRAHGIVVTNTPDVLTDTTADLAFGLLLATARRITEAELWLRGGHWQRWDLDQMLGRDVHHSTLGIIGMGRIGGAIARRAAGFSMRVIYHNRSRVVEEHGAQWVDKARLLGEADHVMLVLPYTPENHHYIGAAELALMKPTAALINIARGGIVDDAALAQALQAGQIAAAGLDVFEQEPKVHPGLLACRNVVLTPHIGSASKAARLAMANLAIDNCLAVLAGKKPLTPVA